MKTVNFGEFADFVRNWGGLPTSKQIDPETQFERDLGITETTAQISSSRLRKSLPLACLLKTTAIARRSIWALMNISSILRDLEQCGH
jgi:hypothetical protein